MKLIETPDAPRPAGHYSQAVVANGFVFVAGILPIVPSSDGTRTIPDGIDAQMRQAFANLRTILAASGSDLHKLTSVQVFVPEMALWGSVNAIYAEVLGSHKPARTVVPCGPLHYGALVELNAIATT